MSLTGTTRSLLLAIALVPVAGAAAEVDLGIDTAASATRFHDEIEPLLAEYCYGCHGDGAMEGNVALDAFTSDQQLLADRALWRNVLRNVRADIMPPHDEWQPSPAEQTVLLNWIKRDALGIDFGHPDPGRPLIRRLNRVEYRNTVRDLIGVEYDTEVEFPPDDSGHGFDNIADVLSLSPLLFEKYLLAARTIIAEAVPTTSAVIPEQTALGSQFMALDGSKSNGKLSFYEPATVQHKFEIKHPGTYNVIVDAEIKEPFDYDPGRCRVTLLIDGEPIGHEKFAWHSKEPFGQAIELNWQSGSHQVSFVLEPLVSPEEELDGLRFAIESARVVGPSDREHWDRPANYERFFFDGPPVGSDGDRQRYAREILDRFASRAFRRPVDDDTLGQLTALAIEFGGRPGQNFESGVAHAMEAVLASPRFLFRIERGSAAAGETVAAVDDYTLASRLSYFLWSTMPDDELLELAKQGQLRSQLGAQVRRMLNDDRSEELVRHFVGQWLQTRDVEGVSIDPLAASGVQEEYERLREVYFPRGSSSPLGDDSDPDFVRARARLNELRDLRKQMSTELREAMRAETETFVAHLLKHDLSVLDLIDSDYTFVNELLAEHYGLSPVEGGELRLVALPADSPRGGVLSQGTFLAVTSNPTRTSPVKRGLFILDNILGTPSPPPPGDVPELEDSAAEFADHEPTLREVLELHRSAALCKSCHKRFDPLGLAFENLNPMGTWRELDNGQPIDTSGQLITGESFDGIRDLKRILRNERRDDFYRCLSERLLTYAIGRGLEAGDEHTVDQITAELAAADGQFSALIEAIISSAPFQKIRIQQAANAGY